MYLGIDPGANGAAVVIGAGEPMVCRFNKATEADIADWFWGLENAMYDYHTEFAMIERVQPRQHAVCGSVQSFKLGQSYGFLRGVLLANKIPFEEVTPQKWQRTMGCLTKGDKNITKARAQQLFPKIKITHGNADALLIAEYCRRVRSQGNATILG